MLFAGAGWNNHTFKPNFVLKPKGSGYEYFRNSHIYGDLVEILENLNSGLDTSECTDFTYFFSEVRFSRIGVIDTRSANTINLIFHNNRGQLEKVDKIILSDTPTQSAGYYSFYCPNLKEITFEGTIGAGEWHFGQCKKLSKASITSIINALAGGDYTPANPLSLSKTVVVSAFGSTDNAEWLNLVASKSNWTISLV
jgi:hypothetical protein